MKWFWEALGASWALLGAPRALVCFFSRFSVFLDSFVVFCEFFVVVDCFFNSFDCFVLVWVVFGSPANFQILSTRRATRAQRALRAPRAVVSYFSLLFVVSNCFWLFCDRLVCFLLSSQLSNLLP